MAVLTKNDDLLRLLVGGGRFEILNLVSMGPNLSEYRAILRSKDETISVLLRILKMGETALVAQANSRRLVEQLRVLAGINHPNVARIHAIEEYDGTVVIAEEFIAPRSLFTRTARTSDSSSEPTYSCTVSDVAALGVALARGLEAVHNVGLSYGGLTPSQVLFRDEGWTRPVLAGFGVSRSGTSEDQSWIEREGGPLALGFLPPECFGYVKTSSGQVTDLYSLGALLYLAARGVAPLRGETIKEMVNKVCCEVPSPLDESLDGFPTQMSRIVGRLLRKSPQVRYQTGAGLAGDLERCVNFVREQKEVPTFALGQFDSLRELHEQVQFVGRKKETERISDALQDAAVSSSEFMIIGARSGIGKSRLASEALRQAMEQGFPVFTTKYSKFERNVPLSGILRALRAHSEWLKSLKDDSLEMWKEQLLSETGKWGMLLKKRFHLYDRYFPDFPTLPATLRIEEEEDLFVETFCTFLLNLHPENRGYAIFFDDIQWADDLSVRVFETLAEVTQSERKKPGAFFLAAYRSEEVAPSDLLAENVLKKLPADCLLQLGPLERSEADELVERLLDETGPHIDRLKILSFQLTEGSPLHTSEYLRAVLKEGVLRRDESGRWGLDEKKSASIDVACGVDTLISNRLTALSATAWQVLATMAVVASAIPKKTLNLLVEKKILRAGDSATVWLPAVTREPQKVVEIALDELVREHLVDDVGERIAFIHDRVREAAFPLLDAEERAWIHTDFGQDLGAHCLQEKSAAQTKDFFEAGFHLLQGHPEINKPHSRRVLFEAGRQAILVFSFAKATEFLTGAVALLPKSPEGLDPQSVEYREWIEVRELHADAQSLSEHLREAVENYREILKWVSDRYHRGLIQSKQSETSLHVFDYAASMDAGIRALEDIGETCPRSEFWALLGLLVSVPLLLVAIFRFKFFSKATRDVNSREEEIRWRLKTNITLPTFFIRPICAMAHIIPTTRHALAYKDNEHTATLFAYWGVIAAVFGMPRTSLKCYRKAQDYFDANPSPVLEVFISFTSAYLLHFPRGELEIAQRKLTQALRAATSVCDSFWRFLCWQGMNHVADYGIGSSRTGHIVQELTAFANKIGFEVPIEISGIRHMTVRRRDHEASVLTERAHAYAEKSSRHGFESIEAIHCATEAAQFHLLHKRPEQAVPLLKLALAMMLRHAQRTALCPLAPVLLAQAYVECKKPFRALLPLAVAWFNTVTGVFIFLPQTVAVSARVFDLLGFERTALKLMMQSVALAKRNGWRPVVAELQLALGELLLRQKKEHALHFLEQARDYFVRNGQVLFQEECERLIENVKVMLNKEFPRMAEEVDSEAGDVAVASSVRKKIDQTAMLEMLAKLSILSDLDKLLDTVLETMCICTGADQGVALAFSEGEWKVQRTRNVSREAIEQGESQAFCIDAEFIRTITAETISAPVVRGKGGSSDKRPFVGASAAIPLLHQDKTLGIVILGNQQLPELFTEEALELIAPLATQSAIAVHNIYLMKGRENQVRIESDLATAKAVQDSLLPFSSLPGNAVVASHYQPAGQTGGDWFGYYFDATQNTVYAFIGDATGHGIGSALVAGLMCGTVYGCLFLNEGGQSKEAPAGPVDVREKLLQLHNACNSCLFSTGARSDVLMTMFFMAVQVDTGRCWVASAGHTHPIHIRPKDEKKPVSTIVMRGTRLGFDGPASHCSRVEEITLVPGDMVVMYTDGLIENSGPSGKAISLRKLKEIVQPCREPSEVVHRLKKAGDAMWQEKEIEDDVTILAFQWMGPGLQKSA